MPDARPPALLLLLLCSSCTEYDVKVLEPSLSLYPAIIDLGDVPVGQGASAKVMLANPGKASLFLGEPEILGESVLVQVGASEIPEGGNVPAQIEFLAESEGVHTGTVRFLQAAPGTLAAECGWSAEGILPDITVEPVALEFGSPEPGERQQQVMVVMNAGRAPLDVSSLDMSGDPAFSFALATRELPFSLGAGASEVVRVDFAPEDRKPRVGLLQVQSDDPDEPLIEVPLTGNLELVNSRPATRILIPADGDVVSLNQAYVLRAWALDAETDPDILDLRIHSSVLGELAHTHPDPTGEVLLDMIGSVVGEDTLTVTTTDPEGLSSSDQVTITVTECEEASWYREEMFDALFDHTLFALNGDAWIDEEHEELVLTEAVDWQAGAVYIDHAFLLQRFRVHVDFRIDLGEGADGLAVAWAGGALPTELLGADGETLGVGELEGSFGYVVEIDVHCNGERLDPSGDHIALVALPEYEHISEPVEVPDLETSVEHTFDVDFNLGTVLVFLDDELILEQTIKDYKPFEGYLGVTAATGSLNNRHVIETWEVETGCW